MAQHMLKLAALFSLAAFVFSAGVKCPGTANYTLTFRALWKQDRHPNTVLPNTAHFSPLVGCSHGADYVMWRDGTKASAGVELVAERGQTTTLENEINSQIAAKKAWEIILASGTGAEGVLTEIHVQVTSNFSKVSLITMIAPSPDWFIGVDSLDLCDNGKWRESWNVTMSPPYDAGTEEGQQFSLSNPASNPHVNIFQITNNTDGAFKNDKPIKSMGEFLFKGIGLPVLPQASSNTTSSTPTASSNAASSNTASSNTASSNAASSTPTSSSNAASSTPTSSSNTASSTPATSSNAASSNAASSTPATSSNAASSTPTSSSNAASSNTASSNAASSTPTSSSNAASSNAASSTPTSSSNTASSTPATSSNAASSNAASSTPETSSNAASSTPTSSSNAASSNAASSTPATSSNAASSTPTSSSNTASSNAASSTPTSSSNTASSNAASSTPTSSPNTASSTPATSSNAASSNTPAPPMDKFTTTAVPSDNAVGKASVSFAVLVSAMSIMAFFF